MCNIHSELNLRKPATRKKEAELLEIIKEFSSLNSEDKKLEAPLFSVKLGTISSSFLSPSFFKNILEEKNDENDITRIEPGLFDNSTETVFDKTVPSYDPTFLNNTNFSVPDIISDNESELF